MTKEDFAKQVKQKYPQYNNIGDIELADKMLEKFPSYKSRITTEVPKQPVQTVQKPVYKPDVERFKEDISKRKENIQQIANREIEGKQGKVSSFLQTTGQVLGVATDFVGEAIVTVGQIGKKILYDPLPEHSKQKFRTEFIEPVKKGIIEPISNKISTGEQTTIKQSLQDRDLPSLVSGQVNKYKSFKEKNPETAYNIEAGLNLVDFIDTFAVAPALIKGGIKKGIKEAGQEAFEQSQKKATKQVSAQIKKEAMNLDYSSKKLTKSFLGSMTSKDVDKYKDDLSRVLAFVTDNDKAVISKSKNATDDFINVFQKNRTDIGNVADNLARQVDDVVDVEMFYIGNELEKKFKDRLKSLSTDITKMGDKVAGKEYAYINDYIKQLKASQNYSASESFDRLKKLNAELSDYYTRKKQPGFTSTKKEKVSIELKAGEADILRNRLYTKVDNALGNNVFSRIRRAQEAFENVNSKVLNKISERNKLASLDLNEDRIFRGIDAGTKAIRVDQPLTIPKRLIGAGKTFLGLEDTKLNDTIKNAFKNLPTKQGVPIKDLITDITDISLKNLDIIKEERYMSDFLQELWKNQDIALLPPPSVIIMPEFSDSAYKAMKDVKLTPPEIVNDNINYQIWVNELNRRPEIKLLTEKATPTSIGTTANPIIPKAPTTYEKPAVKIGNEDFKRIEKFIQDQEALKVFKGNQSKAYDITKDKFNDIKENYPALVETIESHPLRGLENKQSKTGEFAGKLNDKASNLDVLLMERGYNDVEEGREAFEGLKELIFRRQRMEKEISDLAKDLKEIKAGNKTIIDDIINPKSTEIEDINFGEPAKIGTTDTSIVEPKASSMSSELIEEAKKYDNVDDFIKAQGEPLYHGTPVKFDKFDINKTGTSTDSGMFGKGFYFTSNKNIALGYSKGTGNVKTVYLDMKNPYIIEKSSDIPNIGWEPKTIQEMKNSDKIYSEKFTKYMKDNGYDGVIDKTDNSYDQHIVFDSSQIKTESQLKDIYNQAKKTK